jgi:hypothetical protein
MNPTAKTCVPHVILDFSRREPSFDTAWVTRVWHATRLLVSKHARAPLPLDSRVCAYYSLSRIGRRALTASLGRTSRGCYFPRAVFFFGFGLHRLARLARRPILLRPLR